MKKPESLYEDLEYKEVSKISKLSLEKRVEIIKSVMDIYLDISQTDNQESLKKDIRKLEGLEIFPYKNVFDNLDFSEKNSVQEYLDTLTRDISKNILIMLLPRLKKKRFFKNLKKINKPYNSPLATKTFPFLLGVDPPFYLKFESFFEQLSLLIIDVYNKKYNPAKTYFLNSGSNQQSLISQKFEKNILKYTNRKNKDIKYFEDMINSGLYEFNTWGPINKPSSTNYLRAKNHFKNALGLLKLKNLDEPLDKQAMETLMSYINKNIQDSTLVDESSSNICSHIKKYFKNSPRPPDKTKKSLERFLFEKNKFSLKNKLSNENIPSEISFTNKENIIKSLNTTISLCESGHRKWIQNYKEMSKLLKKTFPLDKCLTYQEYKKLYEKLEFFERLFNNDGKNISYEKVYSQYHSSIKNYFLKFIQILNKKQDARFNNLLSKLHFRLGRGDIFSMGGPFLSHCFIDFNDDLLKGFNKTKDKLDTRLYHIKKSISLDKDNFEAYYKLANYYENHNDEKRALETWKKLINCYFKKNGKFSFQKFQQNSINEVGIVGGSNFENFIIKRGKENLFKEYLNTKIIYDLNPNKGLTSKPIAYIQGKDGYNYLFLRNAGEYSSFTKDILSLSDVIKCIDSIKFNEGVFKKIGLSKKEILKSFKVQYLKNSLRSLINFQKIVNSLNLKKETYDFQTIVEDKIIKRLDKGNQYLTNALEFLIEKINKQEKYFSHGDYHPGNILIKDTQCIPIDFERVNYLPFLYDVAFLLEQKEFSDLNESDKKELLNYFFDGKGIKFGPKKSKDYDYMSIFINLRYASISSRLFSSSNNEHYKKDIKIYTEKACSTIDKMMSYVQEKEYDGLNNLKQALMNSSILK